MIGIIRIRGITRCQILAFNRTYAMTICTNIPLVAVKILSYDNTFAIISVPFITIIYCFEYTAIPVHNSMQIQIVIALIIIIIIPYHRSPQNTINTAARNFGCFL